MRDRSENPRFGAGPREGVAATALSRNAWVAAARCAVLVAVLAARAAHPAAAPVHAEVDGGRSVAKWPVLQGPADLRPGSAPARPPAGGTGVILRDADRTARRGNRMAAGRRAGNARNGSVPTHPLGHGARSNRAGPLVAATDNTVRVPAPDMVRIGSGCFAIGSDRAEIGRHEHETMRPVCVEEFFISRYEVTRRNFAAFVRATGYQSFSGGCQTYHAGGWGSRPGRSWQNPGYVQNGDHPVVCVSRNDAQAYAAWLSRHLGRGYRLPTEAEWEYAARAGSTTARHWGDDPDRACTWANVGDRTLHGHYRAWPWTIHHCEDGHVHTAPVGSYRVGPHGLYDMAGNVWEWTCSEYDAAYRGSEGRCAAGEGSGTVRGGSWSNSPRWARSAARFEIRSGARFDLVGFRLAHD